MHTTYHIWLMVYHYGVPWSLQRIIIFYLRIRKKCVRIISGAKYNAHTDPIFRKLEILKLKNIIKLEQCKMMCRISSHLIPPSIEKLFQSTNRTESRPVTGQRNIPSINRHTSKKYNDSFLCKCIMYWQSLPPTMKVYSSFNSFKSQLKQNLLNNN